MRISPSAVVSLILFLISSLSTILLSLEPVKVKSYTLGYWFPPILTAILFLVSTIVSVSQAFDAIRGDAHVKPYELIAVFISLSYICLALNATGVFRIVSRKVALYAHGSIQKLFVMYFASTALMTMVASSDIVIMTLTPLILQFSKSNLIDPTPFLILTFFSANFWSSLLLVSNPTNLIIGQAFDISFLRFCRLSVPATTAGGIALLISCYLYFRKQVEGNFTPAFDEDPEYRLDREGAKFGAGILIACLCVLAITQFTSLGMSLPSITFALIYLVRNYWSLTGTRSKRSIQKVEKSFIERDSTFMIQSPRGDAGELDDLDFEMELAKLSEEPRELTGYEPEPSPTFAIDKFLPSNPREKFFAVLADVPWTVIPFLISVFVLLKGLETTGWIDVFAEAIDDFHGNAMFPVIILLISIILGNLMSSQPMTLLMSKVLDKSGIAFGNPTGTLVIFTVLVASNIAANFSFIGSLSGILWFRMLKANDIDKITSFRLSNLALILLAPSIICFMAVVKFIAF
jgi:Na+/H+ antiporter NhaD/arsenite permease-like protein